MNDAKIKDWLDSLAAKQPTPGGGAVAALAAAMAAAQLNMVTAYTTGPKWQDREARMQSLSKILTGLRAEALDVAKDDAEAFAKLGAAYKLPKASQAEMSIRNAAVQTALAGAAQPPVKTAELGGKIMEIAGELVESGNPSVISDVAVGASLARAALESAIVNIEINARGIKNKTVQKQLRTAVEGASDSIQAADIVMVAVRERLEAA